MPLFVFLMNKTLIRLLLCLMPLVCFAQDKPDLDWRVIELEWKFIKQQVGAPPDLPMPDIIIGNLPVGARMLFQYPVDDSGNRLLITIAPETLNVYNQEMVDWGVGHELTHYAFIMRDNNWNYNLNNYIQTRFHHCDKEFMRITRDLAEVIYHVYHGQRERYAMWDQVQRSCVMQPNQ